MTTISRLSIAVRSESGTCWKSYSYLGLGTVVIAAIRNRRRSHLREAGRCESNGDAGDQYIGLDRFGRVVDQRWVDHLDRARRRTASSTPMIATATG